MNEKNISKYLSFVLRHKPEIIDLKLDQEGWACISDLLERSEPIHGVQLNRTLLLNVVKNNAKQRFQISEDGLKIRAVQGHSTTTVDRKFLEKTPPAFLYHGTAERFISSIQNQGLIPKERQYVHLSESLDTALAVGARYGKPYILTIRTLDMHQSGFKFYQAENNVWLVEKVPKYFIEQS